jgi:serine/threonine protein kinase/tetratricopeptide (TPR) repeat protein
MINAERWQRVKAVFQTLAERPEADCEAALHDLEAQDSALALEVRGLLHAHREGGGLVAAALVRESETFSGTQPGRERAGQRIGSYRLVRRLGEGGMGEVWLGQRADDAYHKQVAVKLVHSWLVTPSSFERFRTEREALARLEHSNIVRLLDGGTDERGVPYFVMEYVDGEPIEHYCDAHGLDLSQRLRLFMTICAAVQHAHQNLIVHRDIKPPNILVTEQGEVKLLDFGIAKLLADADTEAVGLTKTSERPRTTEFASPEQIRGGPITTATDVYSLGVLLYRLLTGVHPYVLRPDQPLEAARIICDEKPARPSAAPFPSPEQKARKDEEIRQVRGGGRRQLRGDLDTIVLMALRKEPQRRYATVERFSEDIRRYLEGLPVLAHGDTLAYRTGKFLRRHRVAVGAAAVIAASLVAGLLATAHQARIAREERDRARVEKTKAEQINLFLQQMLASADPSWYSTGHRKGEDTRVVDVLKQAESKVDTVLSGQPEVRATLHQTIGNTYLGLGIPQPAQRHFEAAVALYTSIYGGQHPRVAESLYYLGAARYNNGDLASAEKLFRQSIAIFRRTDPKNVNLLHVLHDLAGLLITMNTAAPGEAESMLGEALTLSRLRYGEAHPATRSIYSMLTLLAEQRGEIDRAEGISRDLIEKSRRTNDQWSLGMALSDLGRILEDKGELTEAESADSEALQLVVQIGGEHHPAVARARDILAALHCRQRRYPPAEKEARASLAIWQETQPESLSLRVPAWTSLGEALIGTGRTAAGNGYLSDALSALAAQRSPDDPARPLVESRLGECLIAQKRYADAEPLLQESLRAMTKRRGASNPKTIEVRQRLEKLYAAWGRPPGAPPR